MGNPETKVVLMCKIVSRIIMYKTEKNPLSDIK